MCLNCYSAVSPAQYCEAETATPRWSSQQAVATFERVMIVLLREVSSNEVLFQSIYLCCEGCADFWRQPSYIEILQGA